MVQGGRREEGSGWGTRVYLWQIHVDIWQNQYNIVKLKNKIKKKRKCLYHPKPSLASISFPGGSDGKESACNTVDPGLIPGSGRSLEGGSGNPLQYSCLENPMDREAW